MTTGRGPTVTATINAVDHATPVLQRLDQVAENIARHMRRITPPPLPKVPKLPTVEVDKMSGALGALGGIARTAGGLVGGAFALMAGAVVKHSLTMSKELNELQTRMVAFAGVSEEAAAAVRKLGATKLAGYGQKETMEAGEALARASVPEAALPDALHTTHVYAKAMKMSPAEAGEKLVQSAMMNNRFKDENGKSIGIDAATAAQIQMGLKEEAGHQLAMSRLLPGKESDIFEFNKMAGPELRALGISEREIDASQYFLAQGGFTGSHAGQYARGMYSRAAKPTAKSFALDKQFGIDTYAHLTMDKEKITPASVVAGLEGRWGKFDERTRKSIEGRARAFQAGKINENELHSGLVEDVRKSGAKGTVNDATVTKGVASTMFSYAKGVDLYGEMEEAAKKHLPIGWWTARFGLEAGTGAKAIAEKMTPEGWQKIKDLQKDGDYGQQLDDAGAKFEKSLSYQMNTFEGLVNGMFTRVFAVFEGDGAAKLKDFNDTLQSLSDKMEAAAKGAKELYAALSPVIDVFTTIASAPFKVGLSVLKDLAGALEGFFEIIRKAGEMLGIFNKQPEPKPDEQKSIWPDVVDTAKTIGGVPDAVRQKRDDVLDWSAAKGRAFSQFVDDNLRPVDPNTGQRRWMLGSDGAFGPGPQPSQSQPAEVKGTVDGQATINSQITVEPSQWFVAKIKNIEDAIMSLRGTLGGDKVGKNFSGSNGAQPSTGVGAQPY